MFDLLIPSPTSQPSINVRHTDVLCTFFNLLQSQITCLIRDCETEQIVRRLFNTTSMSFSFVAECNPVLRVKFVKEPKGIGMTRRDISFRRDIHVAVLDKRESYTKFEHLSLRRSFHPRQ